MTGGGAGDREYFRVEASLTIRLGPESADARRAMAMDSELWQVQSKLEQKASGIIENQAVSEDLKPILEVMQWLDYKMDLVLYHLRARELDQHLPFQTLTTDISGSGLGLVDSGGFEQNAQVLLALSLPDTPARPVYAKGRIVRNEQSKSQTQAECAVYLEEITDTDRERLIRFNFRQQRRVLARRSNEEVL